MDPALLELCRLTEIRSKRLRFLMAHSEERARRRIERDELRPVQGFGVTSEVEARIQAEEGDDGRRE